MLGPARVSARFDREGVVSTRVEGLADLARGAPVEDDTRFRWYSVTKLVTATVAMRLVDRGDLSLDAGSPRLDALLSHTSGLPDPSALGWVHPPGARRRDPTTLTRDLLARHPPRRSGATLYSNLNYLAIAERIREAKGSPFSGEVAALVGALGMGGTGFDATPAAVGHERIFPRGLVMAALFAPRTRRMLRYVRGPWIGLAPFELEGEAYGGLVGPLSDLVRFGRMHLNDGALDGVRVLEPSTARAMRPRGDAGYGLGFERFADGWIGHEGEAGGFRAALRIHPGRGEGYAALAAWGDAPL